MSSASPLLWLATTHRHPNLPLLHPLPSSRLSLSRTSVISRSNLFLQLPLPNSSDPPPLPLRRRAHPRRIITRISHRPRHNLPHMSHTSLTNPRTLSLPPIKIPRTRRSTLRPSLRHRLPVKMRSRRERTPHCRCTGCRHRSGGDRVRAAGLCVYRRSTITQRTRNLMYTPRR